MCILVQTVGFLKHKSVILQGYKMKNILGMFDFARRFAIRFVGSENQTPNLINFHALIRRMCGAGSV